MFGGHIERSYPAPRNNALPLTGGFHRATPNNGPGWPHGGIQLAPYWPAGSLIKGAEPEKSPERLHPIKKITISRDGDSVRGLSPDFHPLPLPQLDCERFAD